MSVWPFVMRGPIAKTEWGRIPRERSAELYPEAVRGGRMGLLIFLEYFSAALLSCS